jgi:hypothetical protein
MVLALPESALPRFVLAIYAKVRTKLHAEINLSVPCNLHYYRLAQVKRART